MENPDLKLKARGSMTNLSVIVYRSRSVFAQTDLDLFYLLAHAR